MVTVLFTQGGRFPLECLQHNVAIEFPTSAFQTDDATKVNCKYFNIFVIYVI